MKIIDQTDRKWSSLGKNFGGANTYSNDLIKYQIPYWKEVLGRNDLISVCPPPSKTEISGKFRTFVWYLHKYPFRNPVGYVEEQLTNSGIRAENVILVLSYKKYQEDLIKAGFQAVFVPMAINVEEIQKYRVEKTKNFLYFGNLYRSKIQEYERIKSNLRRKRHKLDTLSFRALNGLPLIDREETFRTVSQYKYGIGVGRCALEMFALGLKVIISGNKFGGVVKNVSDIEIQLSTNCNGRIYTYSNQFKRCYEVLDQTKYIISDITKLNHVEETKKLYAL